MPDMSPIITRFMHFFFNFDFIHLGFGMVHFGFSGTQIP